MKRHFFIFLVLGFASFSAARGLTLEKLSTRALEKNPRIQQAKTAVEQAAGQRLVFRSIALPDVTTRIPLGVQGGYRAGQTGTDPFAIAEILLRQPLFQRAIPASFRRGDIEVLLAAQQLNVAVVEQLHQVRIAFYTALYDRSLEALGRSQRLRLDANLTSEEARYEAGSIDRGALASATLLVRNLDPQIEQAHRAYGGAILQLATAMGDDLSPGAALPSPQGTLDFQPANFPLERETSAALERRAGSAPGTSSRPRRARRPAHPGGRRLSAAQPRTFRALHPDAKHSASQHGFPAACR